MALTHNGLVLPYLHFDARSRAIPPEEIAAAWAAEQDEKRGVLVGYGS